jgi:hypothetical protein
MVLMMPCNFVFVNYIVSFLFLNGACEYGWMDTDDNSLPLPVVGISTSVEGTVGEMEEASFEVQCIVCTVRFKCF